MAVAGLAPTPRCYLPAWLEGEAADGALEVKYLDDCSVVFFFNGLVAVFFKIGWREPGYSLKA